MPNTKWSELNRVQLSRCAIYCAELEFASRGYEIRPEGRGACFWAQNPKNRQPCKIWVKASCRTRTSQSWNYLFIPKDKMELSDTSLVCLLLFTDGQMPECYLIPSQAWNNPDELLVSKDYGKEGQTSKPEWGINLSQKNLLKLSDYRAESFFRSGFTQD